MCIRDRLLNPYQLQKGRPPTLPTCRFARSTTAVLPGRVPFTSCTPVSYTHLMEDGSTEAAPPAVCSCTDKCEAGKVNVSCPVCKDNMTAYSGKEAEPETEKPTEQPKEKGHTTCSRINVALFRSKFVCTVRSTDRDSQ